MDMNEYQRKALKTFLMNEEGLQKQLDYLTMGLVGEAGEVANKMKKVLRGDYIIGEAREKIMKELGDVLWYIAVLSKKLEYHLSDVAKENIKKLEWRMERSVIQGDGDDR